MPDHELWNGFLTDPDGNLVGLMKDKRNRQSVLVQENARHSEVVGLRCGLRNAYQNKGWSPVNIQSHVSEAISYWERKRIVYNIVLRVSYSRAGERTCCQADRRKVWAMESCC